MMFTAEIHIRRHGQIKVENVREFVVKIARDTLNFLAALIMTGLAQPRGGGDLLR
jgi:hypothetical protein